MAENVIGGSAPRTGEQNPRSLGAVEAHPPYQSVPLVTRHLGVRLMRTLVAKKTVNSADVPDAHAYDGTPVARRFRPLR